MAEGTRLQELTRNTEARFHEFQGVINESVASVERKVEVLEGKISGLQNSLEEVNMTLQGVMLGVHHMQEKGKEPEKISDRNQSNRVQKAPPVAHVIIDGEKKIEKGGTSGFSNAKLPKVELSKSGGNNPREWVKKCQRYFMLNPIAEEQKVLFASMYFEGAVETWFQNAYESVEGISWTSFVGSVF